MAVKHLNSDPLVCEDAKIFHYITYGADLSLSSSYQKWRMRHNLAPKTFQIWLHNNAEHEDRPRNPRPYIRGRVFSREFEIFTNIMEI